MGLSYEVGKPLGFNNQPEPFDRIEIGRIRRQEDRLKAAPVERVRLMPRGIITDQEVMGARAGDIPGGFSKEGLETDMVGVRKL